MSLLVIIVPVSVRHTRIPLRTSAHSSRFAISNLAKSRFANASSLLKLKVLNGLSNTSLPTVRRDRSSYPNLCSRWIAPSSAFAATQPDFEAPELASVTLTKTNCGSIDRPLLTAISKFSSSIDAEAASGSTGETTSPPGAEAGDCSAWHAVVRSSNAQVNSRTTRSLLLRPETTEASPAHHRRCRACRRTA